MFDFTLTDSPGWGRGGWLLLGGEMEPLTALTPEECATFKRDGVLIKRGVLDPELCRRAIPTGEAWNSLPGNTHEQPPLIAAKVGGL